MAETSRIVRNHRLAKSSSREYTRYEGCGRPHSVHRKLKLCRICLGGLAHGGQTPGIKRASW